MSAPATAATSPLPNWPSVRQEQLEPLRRDLFMAALMPALARDALRRISGLDVDWQANLKSAGITTDTDSTMTSDQAWRRRTKVRWPQLGGGYDPSETWIVYADGSRRAGRVSFRASAPVAIEHTPSGQVWPLARVSDDDNNTVQRVTDWQSLYDYLDAECSLDLQRRARREMAPELPAWPAAAALALLSHVAQVTASDATNDMLQLPWYLALDPALTPDNMVGGNEAYDAACNNAAYDIMLAAVGGHALTALLAIAPAPAADQPPPTTALVDPIQSAFQQVAEHASLQTRRAVGYAQAHLATSHFWPSVALRRLSIPVTTATVLRLLVDRALEVDNPDEQT